MTFVTVLLLVFAIIIAFLLLIPDLAWLRRILDYRVLADVVASTYCVATYAATGAVSGITIAVLAAVGISVTLRLLKLLVGHESMSVGGEESIRLVFAELLTQAARWIRSLFMALFRGGRVDTPAPLNVVWVRHSGLVETWWENVSAARIIV